MLTGSRQKPKCQTTSNSSICLQKNTREKANKSGQRRAAVWVSEDQATETDKGQAGTLPREQAGEKKHWRTVDSTEGSPAMGGRDSVA